MDVAQRADPVEVPVLRDTAEIEVRAPAATAFGVVERDLLAVKDEPGAMTGHRPAQDGPLRRGFRWRQWVVHERRNCLTEWVLTDFEPPRVLEQDGWHFCAVTQRPSEGGERWEFEERGDGCTLVSLSSWRAQPGITGWILKVFAPGCASLSLRKRLAYLQFEAERRYSTCPAAARFASAGSP